MKNITYKLMVLSLVNGFYGKTVQDLDDDCDAHVFKDYKDSQCLSCAVERAGDAADYDRGMCKKINGGNEKKNNKGFDQKTGENKDYLFDSSLKEYALSPDHYKAFSFDESKATETLDKNQHTIISEGNATIAVEGNNNVVASGALNSCAFIVVKYKDKKDHDTIKYFMFHSAHGQQGAHHIGGKTENRVGTRNFDETMKKIIGDDWKNKIEHIYFIDNPDNEHSANSQDNATPLTEGIDNQKITIKNYEHKGHAVFKDGKVYYASIDKDKALKDSDFQKIN